MSDQHCLFCRIVREEIPADVVHRDDRVVAFRDIDPRAPTHILVIPREHVATVNDLEEGHVGLLGHMVLVARDLAGSEGIAEEGYRLVLNTERGAGQSVFHIHVHLLGGRALGWPPG